MHFEPTKRIAGNVKTASAGLTGGCCAAARIWPDQPQPMFAASNIQYEVSGPARGAVAGEISGAIRREFQLIGKLRAGFFLLLENFAAMAYNESN